MCNEVKITSENILFFVIGRLNVQNLSHQFNVKDVTSYNLLTKRPKKKISNVVIDDSKLFPIFPRDKKYCRDSKSILWGHTQLL